MLNKLRPSTVRPGVYYQYHHKSSSCPIGGVASHTEVCLAGWWPGHVRHKVLWANQRMCWLVLKVNRT